ncbi:TRAP transporter substrate-binding protein [Tepidicella xavieri]|jgi:TRAP-type C4-dicarboxylate transport system substrate-binding protein|uniref:TRAP-type C4-dicarboxylate transport system substrate-binding protein n=1 Tax=Tepidicella xavieri TaxID=360241 RepID=A0A4R6UEI0_9BURK|nr:TRAP transporter substrate-binding protein [Tepidicella xavieri]TDQ43559.1 TRAP-type C4-dicarboxylate transport system substrate-binding protein [Tepidicella xavieri]
MIQRRTLLKSGAAVALGAPALVGLAQQTVTLKFHTFMSPTSNVWLNMHRAWMEKVERDSGGRIKFEAYPAMQLGGSPVQLFDQAKDGVVDVVWTLPGNTPGRFPRSEVFELPFMMTNAEATSKAFWEYVQTKAADEFREVKPIAFQVHGPGMFHIKNKAINSPDDLRGLKMRGPTRQITKMLGYLGATPVGMPLPQIPDALSKGVIDGCVIPWEVVPSIRVHELTQFHSEFDPAGGALYTTTFIMGMNQRRYDSLPPDLKKVIDDNSGIEASAFLGRTQQAGDAPARRQAVERGNTINTIGMAEAQEFRRRARQVEVEWVQDMDRRGFNGRDLLESARKLIEKHTKKA